MTKMYINLTCINRTHVYPKTLTGPKGVRFRHVSLYIVMTLDNGA